MLKRSRIKPKRKSLEKLSKNIEHMKKRNEFFLYIWSKNKHFCWSCDRYLGLEPLTYMFDHLLEKNSRKDLEFEEGNIYLCCLDCHTKKTNGFPTEKHKLAIQKAKQKYEK